MTTMLEKPPTAASLDAAQPPAAAPAYSPETCRPQPWRWTLEKFRLAVEQGVFTPEDHLELIHGELIPKMTQNEPHAWTVRIAGKLLQQTFEREDRYHVQFQQPLALPGGSLPEPDLLLVRGSVEASPHHPTPETSVLVVEIADTSVSYDTTGKAALYAEEGIADYWVVILQSREVRVHRDPRPAAEGQPPRYQDVRTYREGEEIAPLAEPERRMRVADLLPRPPAATG